MKAFDLSTLKNPAELLALLQRIGTRMPEEAIIDMVESVVSEAYSSNLINVDAKILSGVVKGIEKAAKNGGLNGK